MSLFLRGGGGPRLLGVTPDQIGKDRISHVTDMRPAKPEPAKRTTKAERVREEARAMMESAREFAEGKPTRKQLRDYFAARIKSLNDGD
jgi:hypothetical protein